MSKQDLNYIKAFLSLALIITAARIYFIYTNGYPLFFDEAQYWDWAKNLDLGYYSKPPMVAWVIAAVTSACGDSEFCIRIPSAICYLLSSIFIFKLAGKLYNFKAAFISAIAFLTLPAVSLSSAIISTDPFLILFWSAALYFFYRAHHTGEWKYWLLLGVACGFGLLSKYSFAIFAISMLIFLAAEKRLWRTLASPKIWVAGILALILYAPNFYWNYANDFLSYSHTGDNAYFAGKFFNPVKFFEFFGSQFGVFGPIMFGALLVIIFKLKGITKYTQERFLISFSLPFLFIILMLSLITRAHGNWAAPAYVAATILVVEFMREKYIKIIVVSIALHFLVMGLGYNYENILQAAKIEMTAKNDPAKRLRGHISMGEKLGTLAADFDNTAFIFDERKIIAPMIYYMEPKPAEFLKWNYKGKSAVGDHYELNYPVHKTRYTDFIFVTRQAKPAHVLRRFKTVERLPDIEIKIYDDFVRKYQVYFLQDFLGYE